jgi:hypothetical protein
MPGVAKIIVDCPAQSVVVGDGLTTIVGTGVAQTVTTLVTKQPVLVIVNLIVVTPIVSG